MKLFQSGAVVSSRGFEEKLINCLCSRGVVFGHRGADVFTARALINSPTSSKQQWSKASKTSRQLVN